MEMRGAGRNFALLTVNGELPATGCRNDHTSRVERIIRGASVSLVPAIRKFASKTDSQLDRWFQLYRIFGIESAFDGTPGQRRKKTERRCRCSPCLAEKSEGW